MNQKMNNNSKSFEDKQDAGFEHQDPFYDNYMVKQRRRTTKSQCFVLENTFQKTTKPDSVTRKRLAKTLNMSERGVQVWFQNRRAKMKRSKDGGIKEDIGEMGYTHNRYGPLTDQNGNNYIQDTRNRNSIHNMYRPDNHFDTNEFLHEHPSYIDGYNRFNQPNTRRNFPHYDSLNSIHYDYNRYPLPLTNMQSEAAEIRKIANKENLSASINASKDKSAGEDLVNAEPSFEDSERSSLYGSQHDMSTIYKQNYVYTKNKPPKLARVWNENKHCPCCVKNIDNYEEILKKHGVQDHLGFSINFGGSNKPIHPDKNNLFEKGAIEESMKENEVKEEANVKNAINE